ncbi:MAG TPA: cytochrome P450 [Allosphingosinicella sp.]|jgi:cytochrome P450|nr:cytochrome P450 [Allosphingosinicella sp.]
MSTRPVFVPPHPPRGAGPVPVWRGFLGERARTAVYGWSELAFRQRYMRRRILGFNVHIPLDPDMVQRVLLDNAGNYVKPDVVKRLLAPAIGEGLLTSDGGLWREQRRIVAANFAPAAVDALVPQFGRVGREALEQWRPGVRNMAIEATQATMRIISNTLFSGDPRLTRDAAMAHIAAALEGVSEARLQAMLGLPRIPWTPSGWRAQKGQKYLRGTLEAVVRERLPDGGPDDFLGKLIRGLGDRFEPRQAAELAADNAMTFYLAGHETTANAVTWTLYLLSEQPDLQERVAAESGEALAGGEGPDLPDRLPLLRTVLEESLRLYPPAPRFDRQAVEPDRLGDEEVQPGDIVSIWPWILHRHQALWDRPDEFDPDRFAPGRREGRHRFQYIPFGAGPRLCVGARFATAEALAILANWLASWRFDPVPGHEVRVHGMVTLRPAGGMPLVLSRRAGA